MKLGFLGTRVGRRFLAVNLLTALVPVAVITAISFTFVRAQLREQSASSVSHLSKSVVMTTLAELAAASLTLIGPSDSTTLDGYFEVTGTADATRHDLIGDGSLAPLTTEQVQHLRAGRPLILSTDRPQGTAITLVRASGPWTATAMPVVWGRTRGRALFTEVDDAVVGEDSEVCIFDAQSMRRIHCSDNVSADAEASALAHVRLGRSVHEASRDADLIVSARDIYLRHAYGAHEWSAVVMRPVAVTFAGATEFRNSFLLLMGAVIALIFGVSHAQIRRTTEPLERLEEATRRLRAGDFGTPVVVTSDDEFAQVANSFNGMASSLHRQISLMRNLDAVDQSALGARDTVAVVAEALATIGNSVPCAQVSLAVAHPTDVATMQISTRQLPGGVQQESVIVVPARERDELLCNPRQVVLGLRMPRSYRRHDSGTSVVLPLVKDDELLGVVCIDLAPDAALPDDACHEARRIADRVALALSNVQLVSRLDALSTGTVLAFARAIDANSPWTAGHSERVTRVALEIGKQLELSEAELDTLQRGGLLHDIGKIAVPPVVLDKAGRLTDEEWDVMRRHPIVGCEILSPIPAFADTLPIVRSHHERMDGTGYPDRLYGEAIPFLARVMAVADVFDALASDRPYRAGMSIDVACDIIQRGSGTHFDPRVVHAFMDAVHAGRIHASMPAGDSAVLAASVARARGPVAQPA